MPIPASPSENDEDGCLPGLELLDERIFDDDLSVASEAMAAQKWCVADIFIVNFETEPRRQQHAERRKDTKHARAVRELLKIDGQPDIVLVFGSNALHEAQTPFLAPGGGSLHTTCQSPCWDLTYPPAQSTANASSDTASIATACASAKRNIAMAPSTRGLPRTATFLCNCMAGQLRLQKPNLCGNKAIVLAFAGGAL